MENTNLFILRLILACIILEVTVSKSIKEKEYNTNSLAQDYNHVRPHHSNIRNLMKSLEYENELPLKSKHKKHWKKSKRDAYSNYGNYGKYWARRSSNYGHDGYSTMPLYLVFNRKVGAYYPYYKYPKGNGSSRRNGRSRNVPKQR